MDVMAKRGSQEWRDKISSTLKRRYAAGEIAPPAVGQRVPEERRQKIADTVRQRWAEGAYEGWDQSYRTPEHNARHSEVMKKLQAEGRVPKVKDKPWDEKRRQEQSARLKGKKKPPRTEEHCRKLSEARLEAFKEGRLEPGGTKWSIYRGPYSTIKMRSKPEVLFAHHLDLLGVEWEYEPQRFDLGWTTYAPDFHLPEFNHWIEIKGYWRDKDSLRKTTEFAASWPLSLFMVRSLSAGAFPETVSDLFAEANLANVLLAGVAISETAPELYG